MKEGEGKPSPDQFDTHADYVEALTDWKLEQRELKKQAEAKAQEMKSSYEKTRSSYMDKLNEFKKAQPDFDEVINDFIEERGNLMLSPAVEESILESDIGPAVFYELVKNPELLERINGLGVVAASKEIGKIEKRLEMASESSKEEKQLKSKAPPPISPVSSKSGSVKRSIFDKDLPFAEYEKLRREQLAKRA